VVSVDVSVVIPTRNRWTTWLPRTLAYALDQEAVELEIIVVDDCSDTPAPPDLVPAGETRVRVLRQESNVGQARARNLALAEARGEWIAVLDDDDLWAPRKLRLQLDAAAARDAAYCYAAALVTDDRFSRFERWDAPDPDELADLLIEGNVVPAGASNMLVRTDLLRELGDFDDGLAQLADWDMWLRVTRAARGAAVAEPLVLYIQHAGGAAMSEPRDPLDELDRLWSRHGRRIDRVGFTRWAAGRMRLAGRDRLARRLYWRSGLHYRDPGNIARAAGLLLGERAMALRNLAPDRRDRVALAPRPDWLREPAPNAEA